MKDARHKTQDTRHKTAGNKKAARGGGFVVVWWLVVLCSGFGITGFFIFGFGSFVEHCFEARISVCVYLLNNFFNITVFSASTSGISNHLDLCDGPSAAPLSNFNGLGQDAAFYVLVHGHLVNVKNLGDFISVQKVLEVGRW